MDVETLEIAIAVKRAMLPNLHMIVSVKPASEEAGLEANQLAPMVMDALHEAGLSQAIAAKMTVRTRGVQLEFAGRIEALLQAGLAVFNGLNIGDERKVLLSGVELGRALQRVRQGKAEEISFTRQGSLPDRDSERSGVKTGYVPGGMN